MEQVIQLLLGIIASGVVMFLHELPKSIYYYVISNRQKIGEQSSLQRKKDKGRSIFYFLQYVDPIGLVFCMTNYVGFSKPYPYRVQDKKTNLVLGLIGFLDLIFIYLCCMIILRIIPLDSYSIMTLKEGAKVGIPIVSIFLQYIALFSLTMCIVNLFPISTFDMGLLIAGTSPTKYLSILYGDSKIKLLLVIVVIFRLIPAPCLSLMNWMLS